MSDPQPSTPSGKPGRRRWLTFSLRSLLILVTLCGVALYVHNELRWQRKKRIAAAWVEALFQQLAAQENVNLEGDLDRGPLPSCPEPLETSDQFEILRVGITSLPETRQRVAGVKLLVEEFPDDAAKLLRHVIGRKNRPEVRALCLRVLSLYREKGDAELALPPLKDRDAQVRAAAADCLGIIHCPAYAIPLPDFFWIPSESVISSDPPIAIGPLIDHIHSAIPAHKGEQLPSGVIELPESMRLALERMMLSGETVDERSAAARALVAWPPAAYRLRYAEWGVWLDDRGELKLVQSVIDETPAFVHRTFNELESFADRLYLPMVLSKPVIHLTTNSPLAVDLDVRISHGRPWFAYPRPDDFSLLVNTTAMGVPFPPDGEEPPLRKFDRKDAAVLQPIAEGFPWLSPPHRDYGPVRHYAVHANVITGLGLRWQSLIVTPQKLLWMVPPDTRNDPRFAWWSGLREVPSSWVSSQGEAERFLYYDGPTLARSPVRVGFDGRILSYCTQDLFGNPDDPFADPEDGPPASPRKQCIGLLVTLDHAGLKAYRVPLNELTGHFVAEGAPAIEGGGVHAAFLKMLTDGGLTAEEARGLYNAWKKQFFETPGSRLLTFLSPAEYDAMCPLTIRPRPTEEVRLGIVLTEF